MRYWIWTSVWMMVLGQAAFGLSKEYVPVYEKSLGQSLVGANVFNDSIYSNPASCTFSNVYSIDGSFGPPKNFAVSILDTKTSAMGGGLGYFRVMSPKTEEVLQGARLMLAGRVSDSFGVGVTGKMIWTPQDRFNNVDVGAFYNLGMLQLGAVAHNTFSENPNLNQFREYAVGGRVNWEQSMFLSVATQGKISQVRPSEWNVGVEYVSPYFFALKGGFRNDTGDAFWSAGASFISPRMGIHYAVEFPTSENFETEHLLGATLLF